MKLKYLLFIAINLFLSPNIFSQITDQELGANFDNRNRSGLYDFSDEGALNIKVSVWGYVARPGKYIVPDYTTVSDLLSYSGGPNQNAEMDDMRIFRTLENGTEEMLKFTYDDIMWGEKIEVKNRIVPILEPSDVLIVPGSPRMFFRDWFALSLQIAGILISILNVYLLILYNN